MPSAYIHPRKSLAVWIAVRRQLLIEIEGILIPALFKQLLGVVIRAILVSNRGQYCFSLRDKVKAVMDKDSRSVEPSAADGELNSALVRDVLETYARLPRQHQPFFGGT
jgi:hypothetical protein